MARISSPISKPAPSDLTIEQRSLNSIKPFDANPRRHSKRQIEQIVASIQEFGFTNPMLLDETCRIIAGHGRFQAARSLGLDIVPTITLRGLTEVQKSALRLADNKIAANAGWDPERLAAELHLIIETEYDVSVTGFETGEIDVIFAAADESSDEGPAEFVSDPDRTQEAVSGAGELWLCGAHRLLCGDACQAEPYARLLDGQQAQMVITDPPYNVPIDGHVSGLGRTKHCEFPMASGELSPAAFRAFLASCCAHMVQNSVDGAIHFIFMDWRHACDLQTAVKDIYTALKNIVVWNKTNSGMGSLYRSKHEFILVFKSGAGRHINNVDLGRFGRSRSNVWDYPGVNTFRPGREEELAIHPTVKPVALVADAIRDCSRHGGIVLDAFAGSGTILLAAEQTGRRAYALELDPHYVDTAVRRWQQQTGQTARHAESGLSFDDVADQRSGARDGPTKRAPEPAREA